MQEVTSILVRSARMAALVAALILLLQWPLYQLMIWLIGPTTEVLPWVDTYFHIVVWGAPASLGIFSLTGWYIGMQNTRIPMVISILQNVVNILASLFMVYGLGMKVAGVALGTVVAQYAGFMVGLAFLWHYYRKLFKGRRISGKEGATYSFFNVNRDIFLRTLFLVAVNLFFTSAGARQGATVLAVNTLLMQLYLLFSYIMDGFAYAGEALGGRYWGAKDMAAYHDVVRRLFGWGVIMTLLFTSVYVFGGMSFLSLLTDEPSVVDASEYEHVMRDLEEIEKTWEDKSSRRQNLRYRKTKYVNANDVLFDPDYNENSRFRVLNTMRSVETTVDVSTVE